MSRTFSALSEGGLVFHDCHHVIIVRRLLPDR
ncbi:hypothetical protein [Vreelandella andesensis]